MEIISQPYEFVTRDAALKVACPLCQAGIGQPCEYYTGEEYPGIHLPRHAKAFHSRDPLGIDLEAQ